MKKYKKYTGLATILSLSLFCGTVKAVEAYPDPFSVVQPDGSEIVVQMHGDEYFHYVTDMNGTVIIQNSDGSYSYASVNEDGHLVSTGELVSEDRLRSGKETLTVTSPEFKNVLKNASGRTVVERLRKSEELRSTKGTSALADRGLVILVNFQNLQFTVPDAGNAFGAMLNQTGYAANGATGSAKDFYAESSSGRYVPQFDVVGPVMLPQNYEFYGENGASEKDVNAKQMMIDACYAAKALYGDNLNFADYDLNGDALLDFVYIYYAGHNEAEGADANTVWPHQSSVKSMDEKIDGITLATYACSSEYRANAGTDMAGIGTFCHEFGHVLGLPDLYDADYEQNGQGSHPAYWCVMSTGTYLNYGRTPPYFGGLERYFLDWDDPRSVTVSSGPENIQLADISSGQSVMINTPVNRELFWVENRQKSAKWDAYLPSQGLLVYHIDLTTTPKHHFVWGNSTFNLSAYELYMSGVPNILGNHQCVELLRANNETMIGTGSYRDYPGHPFPGTTGMTELSDNTTPSLKLWNGDPSGIVISNIAFTGNTASLTISSSTSSISSNHLNLPIAYAAGKKLITENILEDTTVEIYDLTGKLNRSIRISSDHSSDLDLSGVYIVKLKDSKRILTYKIHLQ